MSASGASSRTPGPHLDAPEPLQSTPVCFKLSKLKLVQLNARALRLGLTRSEAIRDAIDGYLALEEPKLRVRVKTYRWRKGQKPEHGSLLRDLDESDSEASGQR